MADTVDRTLWAGNLSESVTEDILYELFLQAGPLQKVYIAKEKDGRQKSFAFVTFIHDASVPYTINLMDGLPLYGKNLRLQSRPGSIHQQGQQSSQQGQFNRNVGNPYQNSQPRNPYGNAPPSQGSSNAPPNPYMANQPGRINGPPQLHKSHTWHGNDLGGSEQERSSQRDRDARDRTRDHHGGNRDQDRDRSGNRPQDEGHGRQYRDNYTMNRDDRSSHSNYGGRGGVDSIESKRERILKRQDEMLPRYRNQGQGSRGSYDSRSHDPRSQHGQGSYRNRRGRY